MNDTIFIHFRFRHAKRNKKAPLSISSISFFLEDLEISDKAFKRKKPTPETDVFSEEETKAIVDSLKESDNIRDLAIVVLFITGV